MSQETYGDKFESSIIVTMLAAIILSTAAVVWMQKVCHHDCRASDYTYCNPTH